MKTLYQRITTGLTAAALIVAQVIMPAQVAFAWTTDPLEAPDINDQSYVCKFVGPAGPEERLQTGNNPIQIARKANDAIGTYFNDNQDRSFVVGFGFASEAQNNQPKLSDCINLTVPKVDITVTPCVEGSTTSDTVSVKVENNDGIIGNSVLYTVKVGNQTKTTAALTDGTNEVLVFSGLAAGNYDVTVSAYGNVVYTENIDVGGCARQDFVIPAPTVGVNDPCGIDNATYKDVPAGNYTVLLNEDGSITLTAATGYTFSSGKVVTLPTPTDSGKLCPVTVAPCKVSAGPTTITMRNQFATDLSSSNANTYAFNVNGGLSMWIDNENDSVAWYNKFSSPLLLSQAGAQSMDYDVENGIAPGMRLQVDINNDGVSDGMLVSEPAAYGNVWWLESNNASFQLGAPHIGGGGQGSDWYGMLDEWATYFPTAQIIAVGFNLSGIAGSKGVLKTLTLGCQTWTFIAPTDGGSGGGTPVDQTLPPVTTSNPVTTTSTTLPAELPVTGGLSSLSAVIIALATAVAAYGAVYFAQGSRRYEQ